MNNKLPLQLQKLPSKRQPLTATETRRKIPITYLPPKQFKKKKKKMKTNEYNISSNISPPSQKKRTKRLVKSNRVLRFFCRLGAVEVNGVGEVIVAWGRTRRRDKALWQHLFKRSWTHVLDLLLLLELLIIHWVWLYVLHLKHIESVPRL